jgi:phosphinothricin acetyltransferase
VSLAIRPARLGDAERIAEIHNEGVEERIATFRAEPRAPRDVRAALEHGRPLLVAELDGKIAGWAAVGPYEDPNDWYAGIGEATVYVAREARGAGVGGALLAALEETAAAEGRYKLIAKIFDTNLPSLGLFEAAGYRRVGIHRRHGLLDGHWKDVVILEKLLGPAADDG